MSFLSLSAILLFYQDEIGTCRVAGLGGQKIILKKIDFNTNIMSIHGIE